MQLASWIVTLSCALLATGTSAAGPKPETVIMAKPGQPVSIRPNSGQVLKVLGHTWSFNPVQDDYTGYDLLKDGKHTGLHAIVLRWDGKKLIRMWHHPYPFDPATGRPWKPPLYTAPLMPGGAERPKQQLRRQAAQSTVKWRELIRGLVRPLVQQMEQGLRSRMPASK